MGFLVAVSLIWAFSFGLTKGELAGIDANLVAAIRLLCAVTVSLFFVRRRSFAEVFPLLTIGAIQFGVMYAFLHASYAYLEAYQVAALTSTTPIFVALLTMQDRAPRFQILLLVLSLVAVVGALTISYRPMAFASFRGALMVVASNIAFAVGQVAYRRVVPSSTTLSEHGSHIFWLFLGGCVVTSSMALFGEPLSTLRMLNGRQWSTLLYLGVVASGVGFFLFNVGATRVTASTLSIMNNAKVPVAVVVSLVFFGGDVELLRLLLGSACIVTALVVASRADAMTTSISPRGRRE